MLLVNPSGFGVLHDGSEDILPAWVAIAFLLIIGAIVGLIFYVVITGLFF